MKTVIRISLLLSAVLTNGFSPKSLLAQSCKDEEAMVEDSKKTVLDLVDMVKKESLQDFESKFHQKSSQSKLKFALNLVNGLLNCLDEAGKETTATKEQLDAYKAKRETYAKLKDKIEQDQNQLKSTEAPKDAKALIEKFDFSN